DRDECEHVTVAPLPAAAAFARNSCEIDVGCDGGTPWVGCGGYYLTGFRPFGTKRAPSRTSIAPFGTKEMESARLTGWIVCARVTGHPLSVPRKANIPRQLMQGPFTLAEARAAGLTFSALKGK